PGADEDPAATFEGERLRSFTAPLFNQEKGGEFARAAKRLLNIPLGILGRPQLHFNEALRGVVRSRAAVLRATPDSLASPRRDAASRVGRLEARRRGHRSHPRLHAAGALPRDVSGTQGDLLSEHHAARVLRFRLAPLPRDAGRLDAGAAARGAGRRLARAVA